MLSNELPRKALRVAATAAAAAFLSMFALGPARAATTTTTFNVTATVAAACSLGTVSNVAFGTYDPTSAIGATNGEANTSIGVTCTSGTTYTVTLNYGANGGTSADRFMKGGASGTALIGYNLYVDNAYANVWQDAADCTSSTNCVYQATASGVAQSYTVYGKIDSTQATAPTVGSYSDTITVTVSY